MPDQFSDAVENENAAERCLPIPEKMEVDPKKEKVHGKGHQIFATIIANLIAVTDGMTMGWTSPMIPYFLSDRTHIKMTKDEAEWIESFILIGAVTGLPITAYLVNKIGRRRSMMLSCLLLVLFWLIIALADKVVYIYLARFGKGIGLNMAFVAMPMFIGEISHRKIRGILTGSTFVFMLFGVIIIYSIGPYVPFVVPPMIAAGLVIIELVVLFFIPESPNYLLMINKKEEAKKALAWFNGGHNVEEDLYHLQAAMDKSQDEGGRLQDLVLVPSNRRAMLIMLVLNFAQLFGSYEVILMNLQEILEQAGSLYLEPALTAIVYSLVMLFASLVSTMIVDKFGRKILLVISTFLSGLCVLALAVYFNMKSNNYDVKHISWIPIASVMSYAACFKFGLGSVPIVITAEVFSQKMKAIGMTIADGVYVVASIIALQVFFFTRDAFGMHAPFYIFSLCLFAVLPFFIFVIPETKGKSLDEIQDIMKKPFGCKY